MHYLNEPLNPVPVPNPFLYSPAGEILAAVSAASSQVHSPETSLPDEEPASYQQRVRMRDYGEWKAAHAVLMSLGELVSERRLNRFRNCLQKAWFYQHNETKQVSVFSSACKDRACPICGQRRSYDLSSKVRTWISDRHDVRFTTLTLRSSDRPLGDQVTALYKAFVKLRRMPKIRRAFVAGIWFFQATFNPELRQWHPHLHCVSVGTWLGIAELSEAWLAASGDSYIVDHRYVYDHEKVAAYVARYSARPYRLTDLPGEKRQEVVLAFHSRRLFGTWGKKDIRPIIKRDKPSLADFTCLGSYSYVCQLRGYDWRADLIFMAWAERTPLDPSVSTYAWDKAVDWAGFDTIEIDPPPG